MIPKDKVDEIIETAAIDEVVGEYVQLKKRGANLLGLCPFHNEKTPSFTVSPAKGIYKCFGCGKGGGSVNFIMDHEQYSYPEALRFLANKYNIEIEEEELSPEQLQAGNEKESLFLVSQFAENYFIDQLHKSEEGKQIGLSYFKERGFREEIIEKFNLGYALDQWEAFTNSAIESGYKLEYLEKTGLTIVKRNEKEEVVKKIDRFKGRVIFPIKNISGRVIAFGGRTLKSDKKEAKYLNSPESDIYSKSKVLYGLNYAKKSIIENDNCYLVEGYTDVISFHQCGIENVVSSSGTSLTAEQIRLIKRYSQNITILFDGDAAGIKASFRGIDMILSEGLNVKVVRFPEGQDPDSFAKAHSTEDLNKFLSNESKNFISFKTDLLLQETEGDPIKKAALIKDIVASISVIPEPINRALFVQECSRLLEIDEQTLLFELNRARKRNLSQPYKQDDYQPPEEEFSLQPKQEKEVENGMDHQEKDIIITLLKYATNEITVKDDDEKDISVTVKDFIFDEIELDALSFNNVTYQKIYNYIKENNHRPYEKVEQSLVSSEEKDISSFVIESLLEKYTLSVNWRDKHNILTITEDEVLPKKIHKGICSWRLGKVIELIQLKQEELKDKESNHESLLRDIQKLNVAKIKLAEELGRIVLR